MHRRLIVDRSRLSQQSKSNFEESSDIIKIYHVLNGLGLLLNLTLYTHSSLSLLQFQYLDISPCVP